MDNENMNGGTFAHALSQLVDAYVEQSHLIQRPLNELAAAINSALRASMGPQFFSDMRLIRREAQKRKRARHIARAAYGLTRKGSQEWRRI